MILYHTPVRLNCERNALPQKPNAKQSVRTNNVIVAEIDV